jgi:hypothetical protein
MFYNTKVLLENRERITKKLISFFEILQDELLPYLENSTEESSDKDPRKLVLVKADPEKKIREIYLRKVFNRWIDTNYGYLPIRIEDIDDGSDRYSPSMTRWGILQFCKVIPLIAPAIEAKLQKEIKELEEICSKLQ